MGWQIDQRTFFISICILVFILTDWKVVILTLRIGALVLTLIWLILFLIHALIRLSMVVVLTLINVLLSIVVNRLLLVVAGFICLSWSLLLLVVVLPSILPTVVLVRGLVLRFFIRNLSSFKSRVLSDDLRNVSLLVWRESVGLILRCCWCDLLFSFNYIADSMWLSSSTLLV